MNPGIWAAVLVWLLAGPAWPSQITDKLAVGLYDSAGDEEPKRILTSGTPLELLERGGRLCRVRLGNGDEGWLGCRYITEEKTARAMLLEAQARNGRLRRRIVELESRLSAYEPDAYKPSRPPPAPSDPPLTANEFPVTGPVEKQDDWGSPWFTALGTGLGLMLGGLISFLAGRRH